MNVYKYKNINTISFIYTYIYKKKRDKKRVKNNGLRLIKSLLGMSIILFGKRNGKSGTETFNQH